jgi:hypothetical protein
MSNDLKVEFLDMNGFSQRNLKYMRKFAECWSDFEFVQRVAAQIPWRNHQAILDKLKEVSKRKSKGQRWPDDYCNSFQEE